MDDPRVLKIFADAAAGVGALAKDDGEYLRETRMMFEELGTGNLHGPFIFVTFPFDRLTRLAEALRREGY